MKRTLFPWIGGALATLVALAVLLSGQLGTPPAAEQPVDQTTDLAMVVESIAEQPPETGDVEAPSGDSAEITTVSHESAPVRTVSTTTAAVPTQREVVSAVQIRQDSDDEILARLRAMYEGLDALRARFTQQVGSQTLEGTVVLSGERYRIEVADQVLVSDGTTAWAYSETDNQVLINHHMEDGGGFSPSAFFATYPEQFEIERTGAETIRGARHEVLRLTPRDSQMQVRQVTLYVRSSDSMPTMARLIDANGQTLTFELSNIERNPRLTAETFRFSAPAGTEVIDLR